MIVRELLTKIGFTTDTSGIKQADNSVSSFLGNISVGKVAAVAALAAVAKGVYDIGKSALFAAADMEMMTTQFEVMLGSTEAADKMMGELNKFAAETPFALEQLGGGSQQLLSFGVAADDVIDTMRMLGDTAGGNSEKLNGLILAYGKVQVKGKASMEEINMMAERGLPIYDILSSQLGVTKENLFGLISQGKVSAENVKAAFQTMTTEGGMFYEGMKKQSLTFHGLVSSMYDNFSLTLAAAGKTILPLAKDIVLFLTDIAADIKPMLEALFVVIVAVLTPIFGMIRAILKPLIGGLSVFFTILGAILKVIAKVSNSLFNMFFKYLMKPSDMILSFFKKFAAWFADTFGNLEVYITKFFEGIEAAIDNFLVPVITVITVIFEVLGQVISGVAQVVADWLTPAFQALGAFFSWLGNIIYTYLSPAFEFLGSVFDYIGEKINQFVDWLISIVNKLPGVNIDRGAITQKLSVKAPTASQKMMAGANPKTTNVSMNNNITMKGTGNTQKDVERIAESIFTIQLKQVLVDAGI